MDDVVKAARIDWVMNASENDSAAWAGKHAEPLLSHAEATESALAVAREETERLTREVNACKDALAQAEGIIAEMKNERYL